jgi:tripartite-type tricarboxylate transporter receptor subunit TctC
MRILSSLFLFLFCASGALAQSWPAKPVRIVVAYPPGGGIDVMGRQIAEKLSSAWGQPVVVENKPGANTILAGDTVAKSAPDGYTVLMTTDATFSINPHLYAKLPYDAARDFAPVALVTIMPFLLVTHPALPVRSVKELVALAKSRPGQLNYGSPGNGSTTHLANELLKSMTGISIAHVPYKGVAPAATDLISGQTQMMSGDLSTLLPHVKSGRMRALAVTSARRSSLLPQMPTVAESGVPGYEASGWFGVLVPASTPAQIVERLNGSIVKGIASADARERLGALGGEVGGGSPEQFGAHIRNESAKWGKVIRSIGLKGE